MLSIKYKRLYIVFKKFLITSATCLAVLSSTATAANLAGVSGTLKNVESAINAAVKKTERMFEEKHGDGSSLDPAISLLLDPNKRPKKSNPYLEQLKVDQYWHINIKFASTARAATNAGGKLSPVAPALLGKDIVLLPVYAAGDEKISAWECLTNVDRGVQEFIGGSDSEFGASFIRQHTKNPYLSLCIYVKQDLVT
jgi:hypothetical protein